MRILSHFAGKRMHLNDIIKKYDIKNELIDFFTKIYTYEIIVKFYHEYADIIESMGKILVRSQKNN